MWRPVTQHFVVQLFLPINACMFQLEFARKNQQQRKQRQKTGLSTRVFKCRNLNQCETSNPIWKQCGSLKTKGATTPPSLQQYQTQTRPNFHATLCESTCKSSQISTAVKYTKRAQNSGRSKGHGPRPCNPLHFICHDKRTKAAIFCVKFWKVDIGPWIHRPNCARFFLIASANAPGNIKDNIRRKTLPKKHRWWNVQIIRNLKWACNFGFLSSENQRPKQVNLRLLQTWTMQEKVGHREGAHL